MVTAGSGIKCPFVCREAVGEELVWSFPAVVSAGENERGNRNVFCCTELDIAKPSYVVVEGISRTAF